MQIRRLSVGSALIYVLVAIVLFAGLSYVFVRQMGQTGVSSQLEAERADLKAGELLQYLASVRAVVEQMSTFSQVTPDRVSFLTFGEVGYDEPPHSHKVHHPVGGGLSVFVPADDLFEAGSAKRGWKAQNKTNVSWSYTPQTDLIYSFVDVEEKVCSAINKRLYNTAEIPEFSGMVENVFIADVGTNTDFNSTDCVNCAGRASLCVKDGSGVNVFYTVIQAR